jgi:peptidyl-prolyl cis-trans isomerase C
MSMIKKIKILMAFLLLLFIPACSLGNPQSTSTSIPAPTTQQVISSPTPTETAVPPTATPVPVAAVVNGDAITLEEYEAEVARYQAATVITGTILASDTNTIVLGELIDQTLLAQAAEENGFIVDNALLQSRIDLLANQLGGVQALDSWIAKNGYTPNSFQTALERSIGAAWMRDHITDKVAVTADQVHVQQILVPTQAEADEVYAALQSGDDFSELASTYDPLIEGDLGWFPRGYLSEPAIEEAAFALQVDQYSLVIHTDVGYHILYLLERDPEHALLPDALRVLQVNAVQAWLAERRSQSEIQILVP